MVARFPANATMRHNQPAMGGQLEQAKEWLQKAFGIGNPKQLKLMALEDSDLEPLWKGIGTT